MSVIATEDITKLNGDWIVWLSNKALPKLSSHYILYDSTAIGQPVMVPHKVAGKKREWLLTRRLDAESALRNSLTVHLGLALSQNKDYADRARRLDARVMPEKLMWAANLPVPHKLANIRQSSSADTAILAIFLVAMVAVERWIAYKRNQ
jgi:hypothetical protein